MSRPTASCRRASPRRHFRRGCSPPTAVSYGSADYDTAVVSQYTTLQRGAVGSSVYALQHRLRELGYPITRADGACTTTDTEKAVQLFYQAYGLEPQNGGVHRRCRRSSMPTTRGPTPWTDEVQTVGGGRDHPQRLGKVGTQVMQIQNAADRSWATLHANGFGHLRHGDRGRGQALRGGLRRGGDRAGCPTPFRPFCCPIEAPAYGSTYVAQEKEYTVLSAAKQGGSATR